MNIKAIRPTKKFTSRINHLMAHLPSQCNHVLDVGNIGDGKSSHHRLQEVVRAHGGVVVGCDLNLHKAIELRYPAQTVGNILALPYRNGTFDVVYLGEILEHLWSPIEGLKEVFRVMRPQGTLILSVPHVFSLERIVKWVFFGRDTIGYSEHKTFFTPAIMVNLLQATGFTVQSVMTDNKIRLGPLHLGWIPFSNRLGAHLLVVAEKD